MLQHALNIRISVYWASDDVNKLTLLCKYMSLIRNYVTIKMAAIVGGLCTERLVLRYKKSKNLSGEAYIQSSNTNSPGIIKTSQKKLKGLAKHAH